MQQNVDGTLLPLSGEPHYGAGVFALAVRRTTVMDERASTCRMRKRAAQECNPLPSLATTDR
jgi:hypothetical protein